MRSYVTMAALAALTLLAGCAPEGKMAATPPGERVDQISALFASNASAGGVPLRLYLYQKDTPLPRSGHGTVEVLLYEGRLEPAAILNTTPYHTWQFTTDELKPYFRPDEYGLWCYHLGLSWAAHPPTSRVVTMLARFVPPSGPPVYSAPTAIVVSPQ